MESSLTWAQKSELVDLIKMIADRAAFEKLCSYDANAIVPPLKDEFKEEFLTKLLKFADRPSEDMPLYINHKLYGNIATWRLKNGY